MNLQQQVMCLRILMCISLFVPPILSVVIAVHQSQEKLVSKLDDYSLRVFNRTARVAQESKEALAELQHSEGTPCDKKHTEAMSQLVFSSRYVREIIYLRDLKPVCSSAEMTSQHQAFPAPSHITRDGYPAWYVKEESHGVTHPMIALGLGHYLVLIDPSSLIDEIPVDDITVHVALTDISGKVVFAYSNAEYKKIMPLINGNRGVKREGPGVFWTSSLFAQAGIKIIAWTSMATLNEIKRKQIYLCIPVSLLISLSLFLFFCYVSRYTRSASNFLRYSLKHKDFENHYQPVVDLQTKKITGAEALSRLKGENGTYHYPDFFMPVAEKNGLVGHLTLLVIENVFLDLGAWLHLHPDIHISINFSPQDLLDGAALSALNRNTAKWGVKTHQIAVEITEREYLNPGLISSAIDKFHAYGYQIYIDDFGTGYSNLSYLEKLNIDVIKIDKSFIDGLEGNHVTPYIIKMAKSMGIHMLAEGIETEKQLLWLRSHGVQAGQGWLFSKALPGKGLVHLVEEHSNE